MIKKARKRKYCPLIIMESQQDDEFYYHYSPDPSDISELTYTPHLNLRKIYGYPLIQKLRMNK